MFDYGMICFLFSLILSQQNTGVSDEVGWWEVGAEQLQKQLKAVDRTLSDSNCCE
jgi:hypothetical protein